MNLSDLLKKINFLSKDSAIGLSIGSSSIKLVELKQSRESWKLLHFGVIQLPEDAIMSREIVNHIAVVESLKTLVHQLKLQSKSVCSSLGGTSVIIKRMQVEVANPNEIQEQVFWEAEQYLPFEATEVYMDYHLISYSKETKIADVILVAAKRSVVNSYVGAIQDAGLKTRVMDLDFFALQNVFEANYPAQVNDAVALVDIGASSLKVVVAYAGVPVFSKEAGLGGKALTADIQRHLNLPFADAESLKCEGQQGREMPQEVSELMQVMSENIAGEIKRAIDVYSASSSGAPVTSVLISGGTASLPNLSQVIEETTQLPTQILNPFNAITYDPAIFTPEYIEKISPIAALAIGLALRASSA